MSPDGNGAPAARDPGIDIVKGIAILLIVYGHTWPFCRNFLYQFHVPVFLVVSGYCFKNRIRSRGDWGRYALRKLRALYVPCAVCNGIYALLGGCFLRLGLYTDEPAFLTLTRDWPVPQTLYTLHGPGAVLRKFLRVILLSDTTQMGTATWFLITLLAICLLHGGFCLLTAALPPGKKRAAEAGLFALTLALAEFVELPFAGWRYLRVLCYCYPPFLFGVWVRELKLSALEKPLWGLVSFAVLALLSRFCFVDLANAESGGLLPYLAGIPGGWCMLKAAADCLTGRERLSRVLCFFGRNTMPIVCLHVLCFKAVTWLYVTTRDLPGWHLAAWHVDFDAPGPWKLLYFLAGSILPLCLAALWRGVRRRVSRAIPLS